MCLRFNSSILLVLLLVMLLVSCGADDGYTILEDGAKYRRITLGDAEIAPGIGQYVSYQIKVFDDAGKSIYSTHKRGIDKDEYVLFTHDKRGVLQRNMQMFYEEDSISFILDEPMFKEQFPFINLSRKHEYYRVELRINHVEDRAARDNRLNALASHIKLIEDEVIAEYIESLSDSISFEKQLGIYIHVVQKGFFTPKKGDRMLLSYEAFFLTGEKFDDNRDTEKLYYTKGDQGQILVGLQRVVSLLGVGSKSWVVIPSDLAFGDTGSTGKVVPPNTPLMYKLEVLEDED